VDLPLARYRYLVRAVPGLMIAGCVIAVALAVLLAGRGGYVSEPPITVEIGPITVVVSFIVPTFALVAAGVLGVVALALLVVAVDAWAARRVTDPVRRVDEAQVRTLRSEITLHREPVAVRITALIPAHDEEANLPATLTSLQRQTRPPESVWVVADNCTDGTADVARRHGAQVHTTVDNVHKKAGGLNQLLAVLLPQMGPADAILVMDADTAMSEDFLAVAARALETVPDLDAVGGVFFGDETPGLLPQLQRNEFVRYARDVSRHHERVFVLTGTASLFRAEALSAVAEARGTIVAGRRGDVYDTLSLTEDNEITLALKTLGARLISPRRCRVVTELMPTWGDLWRQRERWQRGALENIGMYGVSSATARYWMQQIGIGYGVLALNAYFLLMVVSVLALHYVPVVVFWLLVGLLFAVERVVTVWDGGWRARLLAAPLVIELGYDWVLQLVYVKSLVDIALGRSKQWSHVRVETEGAA
jgi:cellulose synthase/poly-beta-1,6-N-acetylglucosamine synthase-like glycosyltransferase